MRTISTEQIRQWREQKDDFLFVNVLKEDAFREQHIPGSINIPVGTDDFESKVESKAGDKDKKIVVYCASKDCSASPNAAKKLDKAGFSNVYDYETGLAGWSSAGLETQSAS